MIEDTRLGFPTRFKWEKVIVLLGFVVLAPLSAYADELVEIAPKEAGLPATFTRTLDSILQEATDKKQVAGAEAMVLLGDSIVYHGTAGFIQKVPQPVPMHEETLFDLASLTKMVATTTSLMILCDRGEIALNDPVAKHLKDFDREGYRDITIWNLLTHTSGLPHLVGFYEKYRGKVIYRRHLFDLPMKSKPGEKRVYSDTGFMVAGWVVEAVSGKRLDKFAEENIFQPLGMNRTYFNPPYHEWTDTAATELCPWRGEVMRGEVHDENSYSLGGISGHAGLFSTVSDLAIFCRMMLQGGEWNGVRLLKQETVERMLTPQKIPDENYQGIGWWLQEERGQKVGSLISDKTFGHTGFTGTSLWMDPDYDLTVILLTNAIHPNRKDAERTPVRQAFHRVVAEGVEGLVR
ncbi:MAG: serine hydrolase [Candidatus Omnitrophica bacterium]|nr:serine hydrolase [Candidatus Omnitrophota bacterium]